MTKKPKLERYFWYQFDQDAEKIAAWARQHTFKGVYGIPRGGLVLAVKLSHLLDIPLVLRKDDIRRDTLIVDDIIDTGETIKRFLYPLGFKFFVASIFFNEKSKYKPNFSVRRKKRWVVFPWEITETSQYDGTI